MTAAVKHAPNFKPFRDLRALDYVYDPEFIVSGKRDYERSVRKAIGVTAEFKICPNFATMFSDYKPRYDMVLSRVDRVPPWYDKSWEARQRAWKEQQQKPVDVSKERYRFFRRPVAPFLAPTAISLEDNETASKVGEQEEMITKSPLAAYSPTVMQSQGTQTKYRESEAQTLPWAPPTFTHNDATPEVMTLANLSYGTGLPAGMHEIAIIERARKRRAWEQLMPKLGDAASVKKIKHMIETLEKDEWQFREKEIQDIHEMRLELAKKLIKETQKMESSKLDDRLKQYWDFRSEEKKKKIQKIRQNLDRELRKLNQRHKGVVRKYKEMNVLDEHIDRTSELYGPQMRFGVHPKRRHEVIKVRSKFLSNIKGLEILESVPKLAPYYDYLSPVEPRKSYELCVRLTRWSDGVLKKLYEDLNAIRAKQFQMQGPLRLVWKKAIPEVIVEIPQAEGIPEEEEQKYQAAVLLQKTIKGRAIQTLICKGRRKCQELINELKSTNVLQPADEETVNKYRTQILELQHQQAKTEHEDSQVAGMLGCLEGQSIGFILDLLSKELLRLQDARREHAFALLAERVRYKREAAEAGRRQKQEHRRREHDEMFKQILKVHQDTVDMYLEDIIVESMNQTADEEARLYVQDLAKKIDKAAYEFQMRQDDLEKEELVADLIHSFVVPEVQKQIIREQVKKRQSKYLREAHSSIYGCIQDLPTIITSDDSEENYRNNIDEDAQPQNSSNEPECCEIPETAPGSPKVVKSEDTSAEESITSDIFVHPEEEGNMGK